MPGTSTRPYRVATLLLALAGLAFLGAPACRGDGGGRAAKGKGSSNPRLGLQTSVPGDGPEFGGTVVTIVGFGFVDEGPITDVLFGAAPAASFAVQSDTVIDAVTPPQAAGLVDIVVRNASGDEASLSDAFRYRGTPTCRLISPNRGSAAGGDTITIWTSDFSDDFTRQVPMVTFGGIAVLNVSPLTAVAFTCTTPPLPLPPAAPQAVDVTVTAANGESCTFFLGYTYEPAGGGACMGLRPDSGTAGGAVTIFALGNCLWTSGSQVLLGAMPATGVTLVDATTLSVIVPPGNGPGPVDVTVTGELPGGGPCTCTLANGFTYR